LGVRDGTFFSQRDNKSVDSARQNLLYTVESKEISISTMRERQARLNVQDKQ